MCACGVWVRDEVAVRTGGECASCFQIHGSKKVTTIELVGRGMVIEIPRYRNRKRKSRPPTEQAANKKRLSDKAKRAARKRLAAMFPDVYDMLLAEERGLLGLEPWPTEIALRGGDPNIELGFAEMMTELESRGVTV